MKYLMDTHVFVWATMTPQKLSASVQTIFQDPLNSIFLSIVSVWEMQIKIQTGKFAFPDTLDKVIMNQRRQNAIRLFQINTKHIYGLANLPFLHKDPFDRLLISQSIAANIPLITDDAQIVKYPVKAVW